MPTMTTAPLALFLAADESPTTTRTAWLIAVLAIGIVFVAVAVGALKLHPVLSLLIGGVIVGLLSGLGVAGTVSSLTAGVGNNLGSTGLLIVLGAMFGILLSESGAATRVVSTLTARVGERGLPWVVVVASVVVGLPMFFEVGFVTLIPIVIVLAKNTNTRMSRLVFPMLAGLDAAQCLLPPHPGPVAAANALGASIGLTLLVGLAVALPGIIVTGPVLGRIMGPRVEVTPPKEIEDLYTKNNEHGPRPPGAVRSLAVVFVPIVLIIGKAIVDVVAPDGKGAIFPILEFVGTPAIALLISVLVALIVLGLLSGSPRATLSKWIGRSLGPIAGITFIVGAAGGFSKLIVDSGAGDALLSIASGAGIPILLLAFGMAAILVTALGSSTVAGLTAATLVAPSVVNTGSVHLALLALAAGAGSSFLVHVNSAGFWLSKEYFGLTVKHNLRVWTLTHTILSLVSFAIICVLWYAI